MKIMLIASNTASSPYPVYPLGLSTVASALENAGHEVVQYDFLKSDMSFEDLTEAVKRISPGVVGISIRNIDNVNLLNEKSYIGIVKDIVTAVKNVSDVNIVLGGCGFSIMPEEILSATGADYGIVGEGEAMMVDFVSKTEQGCLPEPGCLRREDRLSSEEISAPSYDSELMKFYLKRGGMGSIQTKRGCSLKCLYCSYPYLEGEVVRPREPKAIVADIKKLIEVNNAKYIFFIDSVFNDDEKYYVDLLKAMKKEGIYIPWTAFFKPENLTDEEVILMKETGLHAAEIGADAASDTTLNSLRKPFLFKDVVECNDLFLRHGISTAHYYMFGCPDETRQTALEGIENIKRLKGTVSFIFMGIRILPGTGLFDRAIDEGVISAKQDMLDPVFYIAPSVESKWLEETLTEAFKGQRNCVFPPDKLDSSLEFMHQIGAPGSMWDTITPKRGNDDRK